MRVGACGGVLWLDERCDGLKKEVYFFSAEFFDCQIQSKKSSFSTGSSSRVNSVEKS